MYSLKYTRQYTNLLCAYLNCMPICRGWREATNSRLVYADVLEILIANPNIYVHKLCYV